PAEAAVSLDADAGEAQLLEGGQQLERESVFDPILVDDGRDFRLHERAHPLMDRALLGVQEIGELIEIAARRRKLLRSLTFEYCRGGHFGSPFLYGACIGLYLAGMRCLCQ